MSWETRSNGRRYYTRSWRVNGKVVRMYIGGGGRGNAAAVIDCTRRQLAECQRQERAAIANEIREFETDLLLLDALADAIARAALEAAGFHQHARGQWRKRRVPRNDAGARADAGGHPRELPELVEAGQQGGHGGTKLHE